MRISRHLSAALCAVLLAGCLPGPAPTGVRKSTLQRRQPAPASQLPSSIPVEAGAGLVSNNGGGIISNNAGALVGAIKAPASVISANGGALISDRGGTLVSNNGAGYRLLAVPEQYYMPGVTVRLLDAAGHPALGADGQPLTATTDEQGRYAFAELPAGRNMIVAVTLAQGQLASFVPREGSGQKVVDADLVSTLTTTYILDQYVRTQADPLATFEKLPAEVEADTRKKAAAALVAAPDALTSEKITATVAAMRQNDATFDAQMEVVKKLLVAAGQSDLGSGELGTEVGLSFIGSLALAPAGALYIQPQDDPRVWRLKSDGRIETAVGGGQPATGSLDGQVGTQAGLGPANHVTVDASGRLLIAEDRRVTRLEADGKLKQLWTVPSGQNARHVFAGSEGEVLVITVDEDEEFAELHAIKDGQATLSHSFAAASERLLEPLVVGRDSAGNLYAGDISGFDASKGWYGEIHKWDATAKTWSTVAREVPDNLKGLSVDPAGHMFLLDANRTLSVRKPDGTTSTLLAPLPEPYGLSLDSAVLAPDGSAYIAQQRMVFRIQDGQIKRVAGVEGGGANSVTDLSLVLPGGAAPMADGSLIVADMGRHQLFRVDAQKRATLFAGKPVADPFAEFSEAEFGDGGQAVNALVLSPRVVRGDAAGNVYVDGGGRIRKIDTSGVITTVYQNEDDLLNDFVVRPDGTLVVVIDDFTKARVRHLKSDGTFEDLFVKNVHLGNQDEFSLAQDQAGDMFVLETSTEGGGPGTLWKWADAGAQQVGQHAAFMAIWGGSMAIDPQGRFYFAKAYEEVEEGEPAPSEGANTVFRYDPAAGTIKTIAGEGGTHFNGAGVDGSVLNPGFPAFEATGTLFFSDIDHRQIKRVPANEL